MRLCGVFVAESQDTLPESADQRMRDTLSQEQPLVAGLSHKIVGDEPLFDELSLTDTDEVSPVAVKGRYV